PEPPVPTPTFLAGLAAKHSLLFLFSCCKYFARRPFFDLFFSRAPVPHVVARASSFPSLQHGAGMAMNNWEMCGLASSLLCGTGEVRSGYIYVLNYISISIIFAYTDSVFNRGYLVVSPSARHEALDRANLHPACRAQRCPDGACSE